MNVCGTASDGANMILSDLVLSSRKNQYWLYSGIDTLELCNNKIHFQTYPYDVDYQYNDRGFRDSNWPMSRRDLQKAIWCLGDSFTVGLGQPYSHIWPQILSECVGVRTINVSMDGASNNWISRRALDILDAVKPECMIVLWSYVERREITDGQDIHDREWRKIYEDIRDPTWPACNTVAEIDVLPDAIKTEIAVRHKIPLPFRAADDNFICQNAKLSFQENLENWKICVNRLSKNANIIHSTLPKFADAKEIDRFSSYLEDNCSKYIGRFDQVDFARDAFHFGKVTCQNLVDLILPHLAQ